MRILDRKRPSPWLGALIHVNRFHSEVLTLP